RLWHGPERFRSRIRPPVIANTRDHPGAGVPIPCPTHSGFWRRILCGAAIYGGPTGNLLIRLPWRRTLRRRSQGWDHVGTDDQVGGRLASKTDDPSSLAKRLLCRHTPEAEAVCGGRRGVTSVPTATFCTHVACASAHVSGTELRRPE